MSIRRATKADLDRIVEIHLACYPDDRNAAHRRLNFVQNTFGRFDDLRVAVHRGRVVGHGFGFALEAYFGGVAARAVGIASIGVAPEARGVGVSRELVVALEDEARKRGAVLSILHAFRHGFYKKLGYADVSPSRRLACDPRAIPREWVERARAANLRAATAKDLDAVVALHRSAAKRATGWNTRTQAAWKRRFEKPHVQIVMLEGAGYVAFTLWQSEAHARTRLDVIELVAKNDAARRTLWGLLGMQAGQVTEIAIEVSEDDPILFALTDVDGARHGDDIVEHDLGCIVAGPMIRMLDIDRALAARGYACDGEVDLVTSDRARRLTSKKGRAKIGKGRPRHAITLDERTLASIAFGGLSAIGAHRLGLVTGHEEDAARASDVFRIPPFFTLDRF